MDLAEWLDYGMAQGFCSPAVCATHEGLPCAEGETERWEAGEDPCVYALRLYHEGEAQKTQ